MLIGSKSYVTVCNVPGAYSVTQLVDKIVLSDDKLCKRALPVVALMMSLMMAGTLGLLTIC
jgi:hypothetical protein